MRMVARSSKRNHFQDLVGIKLKVLWLYKKNLTVYIDRGKGKCKERLLEKFFVWFN